MVRRATRRSGKETADVPKQQESPKKTKSRNRRASTSSSDSSEENASNVKQDLVQYERQDLPLDNETSRCSAVNDVEQKGEASEGNAHGEDSLKENEDVKREQWAERENAGKGKSKSKHKTDLENSSLSNENEQHSNSHISETVQVTAQSPSNDIPVDNKNGNNVANDDDNYVQTVTVNHNIESISEDARSDQNKQSADSDQSGQGQTSQTTHTEFNNIDNDRSKDTYDNPNTSSNPRSPKANSELRSNSTTDLSSAKDNKKIRLRRNTVPSNVSTESSSKTMQPMLERASSHIEIHSESKQLSESEKLEGDRQPPKKAPVKVKLRRNFINQNNPEEEQSNKDYLQTQNGSDPNPAPYQKKRDWTKLVTKTPVLKIDFKIIKECCNSIEVSEEKDVKLNLPKERRRSSVDSDKRSNRKVSLEFGEESDRPEYKKQSSSSSSDDTKEDNTNIIAFNRKISIVDDTASKLRPPPEPAKNPVSEVLYITNLVRPFTIKQLKELLERTGKIKDDGFWTDRIKSKCYVHYETKEEAEATRNALHGVHWPVGNGKQLMIEYSTPVEMEQAQNPPPPPLTPPLADLKKTKAFLEKENKDPVKKRRVSVDGSHKEAPRDKVRRRSVGRVREWDIGKEDLNKKHRSRSRSKERYRSRDRDRTRSRNKDRSRDRNRSKDKERDRSHKHRRTPTPINDYIARKQKKTEEEVPQKLMDDLFLKTKATPSIYWQPLSPEEIATKQQQRLIRMEEHKRRMEVTRNRGGREQGRGVPYRRR